VGHPVDELYGALQPAIAQQRIAPFLTVLEDLRQQVRIDPASPSTDRKLAAARQAVATAARSLSTPSTSDPAAVMVLARQLATTAADPATTSRLQRMEQGIAAMLKAVPTAVPPPEGLAQSRGAGAAPAAALRSRGSPAAGASRRRGARQEPKRTLTMPASQRLPWTTPPVRPC
jgi:hypothetical protein